MSKFRFVETIFLALIFFALNNESLCQSDLERLNYFPVHIGDEWHYQMVSDYFDGNIIKSINIVSVIGDTILNNNRYFVFKNFFKEYNQSSYEFIRIDSVKLRILQFGGCADTEKVVYDLSKNAVGWKNCGDLHEVKIVGETVIPLQVGILKIDKTQLAFWGGYWIQSRYLAKDFGLCKSSGGELMSWVRKLYYARINNIEYGSLTDIYTERLIPDNFSLSQNYPNPFNPETTISYKLPAASNVSLKVYDVLGRKIATLVDEYKQPGTYNSKLNTQNFQLPSGVYFYRLQAGSYSETKKLILMK